ncbi:hypothetical protein [Calidithermus chliarophilus]|uniref:hypothetical protein n=1 Tax=Calidithermus chliarophilus TaxID=52023 RepID=UPI0004864BBA|nr:hypothetical protein [Calidithermus chliarophilus]
MATILEGNPGVGYKNSVRGIETTDPVHPVVNNPVFQDLLNNDANLNQRVGVVEGQNLDQRLRNLEAVNPAAQLAALDNRLDVLEGHNLDPRLDALEALDIASRLQALEDSSQVYSYGPAETPPADAPLGAVWVRGRGLTLRKIGFDGGANRSVWVTMQPTTLKVVCDAVGNEYRKSSRLDFPNTVDGLPVVRGWPLSAQGWAYHLGFGFPRMSAWYNLSSATSLIDPDGTTPADTSGSVALLDSTEARASVAYANADPLTLPAMTPGRCLFARATLDFTDGDGPGQRYPSMTHVELAVSFALELALQH